VNFFEHQDQSRRQTRRLIFLFILAVLAIIAAVNVALLVGFGLAGESGGELLSAAGVESNAGLLIGGSLITAGVIGLSSLFKSLSLAGGGGRVARDLGGTLVEPDTRDPLKRRLVNVVEEIALASGIPVPEVYVLEKEAGINAFAAGFSTSDAVIAVTRGTLEKLDRNELQGVIAHEFSHIFNGDMRLNIRLMGALFGILLLAIIGRRILLHAHLGSRSRDSGGAPILVLALTLTAVGYIGLFFGRWIKSAVSRQREYLADASAVQFTREPEGIAGALKKIAVYSESSHLDTDSEEVGHMLFGPGQAMHLFATHPPLMDRIRRIEPGFDEEELAVIERRIARREARSESSEKQAEVERPAFFDPRTLVGSIGSPDLEQILLAAAVAGGLPDPVREAAHSSNRAPMVLMYALLHTDDTIRDDQLLAIAQGLGLDFETGVRNLYRASGPLAAGQGWPLLEILLPSLRRQPAEHLKSMLEVATLVVHADQQFDVFEYLVLRLIRRYLWESVNPRLARASGSKSLKALQAEASGVIAVLAMHGHPDDPAWAQRTYETGFKEAFGSQAGAMPEVDPWVPVLDQALDKLDRLKAGDKQVLVLALVATVNADGQWLESEAEMLRAICASLHVPLPLMSGSHPR
jgi:Zn-dependent protease with chaperone function